LRLTDHFLASTMEKHSRIYIAGHTGLVGSAILRRLQSDDYINLITRSHAELDLTRQADVEAFFAKEKPEYVFLAAAKVGGIWANNTYPAEFIYQNVAIQINVLHSAWRVGVKRLVFLGSSCIYPRECPQPMKEEHLLTGTLEPTNQPYAVAKIAGIIQCEAYNRQYGTRFLALMPTNLYGPNDNYDLENSHVLPALIRKFHLAKLASGGDWEGIRRDETCYGRIPQNIMANLVAIAQSGGHTPPWGLVPNPVTITPAITLWGSGSPRREFLHVDDLADACVFIMSLKDDAFDSLLTVHDLPLVNVGCGRDQTIRELADLVATVVGFDGEVEWDPTKPDGTPRKLLDVSQLTSLGWKPKISLKEGIRHTYQRYIDRITD